MPDPQNPILHMILFDRDGNGGAEITAALGLISDRVDFAMWAPIIPLGIRDVAAIVGHEPVEALASFYESGCQPSEMCPASATIPLGYLKQAVAMFTWLKIIPTLDAHHDTNGRSHRLGENEKGMTALEQFKDESNIQRLAYEATDALIEALDRGSFGFWTDSSKYRQRAGLLIRSKEEFDCYYVIGSHRLFLTLLPMIREVQSASVAPVVGREYMARLLDGDQELEELGDTARRAIALLAMKKAVERLPVEVLPDGVVQVNQSAPVKQRLQAEKEARNAVAASLGADADRYLRQLEDIMAAIRAEDTPVDYHLPGPIVHSKGMSY